MKKLLLITFFLLVASPSFAATYYVSPSGLDSRSCSTAQVLGTPKQHLKGVNGVLACLSGGDTLEMLAGTYTEIVDTTLGDNIPAGSAGANTIIKAHSSDVVIMTYPSTPTGILLHIEENRYITIQNIILDGTVPGKTILITGIRIATTSEVDQNITITGCEIKNFGSVGILIGGGHDNINHNNIHDNGWFGGGTGYAIYDAGGSFTIIDSNQLWNSGYSGMQLYYQVPSHLDHQTVSNNDIYDNDQLHQGAGVVFGGTDHLVFNNRVHNTLNNSPGFQINTAGPGNITFYNNIIYGNTGQGIEDVQCGTGGFQPCHYYNNTSYGNGGFGFALYGNGAVLTNNISSGNSSGDIFISGTGSVFTNNLCASAGTGCASNGNPFFVNPGTGDFHLTSSSTLAIGHGTNLSSTFTTDFYNNIRPIPFDLGAVAYIIPPTVNPTTTTSCDVRPNINAIGISCPYTGDDNVNNTAIVEYKASSSSTWITAYAPYNDRRALTNSITNPYYRQFRTSLVGLLENTSYDVRITYTDVDGVSGLNPVSSTVTTVSKTPTAGAGTCNATDNTTRNTCLAGSAGTINLAAATYNAFTVARSGSAGNYLYITCAAGAKISSGSGDGSYNLIVNGSFVVVQGCELLASDWGGIAINGNHVYIKTNTIDNVGVLCANGNGYNAAGIQVAGTQSYILNNHVSSTALAASACTGGGGVYPPPIYNSPAAGITWNNMTDLVVDGNIVDGAFRDAITMDGAHDPASNIDISNNDISNYKDDGAESKGGINIRIWQNHIHNITAGYGNSCIAMNSDNLQIIYGPMYSFRNDCKNGASANVSAVFKLGGNDGTPLYLFHNSTDMVAQTTHADYLNGNQGTTKAYNNIGISNLGNTIATAQTGDIFDYNIYSTGNDWAYMFNGVNRNTPSLTCSNEGQDCHSFNANPLFTTFPQINVSSLAYHTGTPIPGFNGCNSAWPSLDSEINKGAFQTDNGCSAPVAAPGITVGGFFLVQ